MSLLRTSVLFFACFFIFTSLFAQEKDPYPKVIKRMPLDEQVSITGNFANIRPNHFHSGIDLSTSQRIGLPVYAVSDGWVSRIRQKANGYGKAIYINHASGYTSVYAHLDRFGDKILREVVDYQYQNRANEVDFALPDGKVKVSEGDLIAYSGDTGGSQAPHLHFEIRETRTENVMNPLLFGFKTQDLIPPLITSMKVHLIGNKPFSEKTYSKQFSIFRTIKGFEIGKLIKIPTKTFVGFSILSSDCVEGGFCRAGIYKMEMFLDGELQFSAKMDKFAFDESRAVNSCVDYPHLLGTKERFLKAFLDPGNPIPVIKFANNDGFVWLDDEKVHLVRCVVSDFFGNRADLEFSIQGDNSLPRLYQDSKMFSGKAFYWDARNTFSATDFRLMMDDGTLYDDMYFNCLIEPMNNVSAEVYSPYYKIGNPYIPIHKPYTVWIKPYGRLPQMMKKYAVLTNEKGEYAVMQQDGEWLKAEVKSFGTYKVVLDTNPPDLVPSNIKSKDVITFYTRDSMTGISGYDCYMDGKWIPAEMDIKTHKITIRTGLLRVPNGSHVVEVESRDGVQNRKQVKIDWSN